MTISDMNRAFDRAVLSLLFLAAFCGATRCGAQVPQMEIFDTNGNFTVPTGVSNIIVELWGGGGAGGQAYVNTEGQVGAGGGGGGGAYGKTNFAVTPGHTYTVTVGAGGNSLPTHSNNGGASSFGFLISAHGGTNGSNGFFSTSLSNAVCGAGGPGGAASGVTTSSAGTNLILSNSIALGAIATGVTAASARRGTYTASLALGGIATGTTAVSGQSGTYSANPAETFGGNGGASPSGGLGGRGAKVVNGGIGAIPNSGEAGQVPGGGRGGGGGLYLSTLSNYEVAPPGLGAPGRVIVYY